MADWQHETYRRIYRTPDPKWLTLSASTRALAAELLRWVDDDGALYLRADETAAQGIARVLQAPRSDASWVKRATTELALDGHIVVESDRVTIRNFKAAQGIVESAAVLSEERNKAAIRAAEYRKRKRERVTSRDGERDASRDASVTERDVTDRDESRDALARAATRVPTPAPPPASRSVPSVPSIPEEREREAPAPRRDLSVRGRAVAARIADPMHHDLLGHVEQRDIAAAVMRIDADLQSLAMAEWWPDINAEVDSWITLARTKSEGQRANGYPMSPLQALSAVEGWGRTRCRERPAKARIERDRRRNETQRANPTELAAESVVDEIAEADAKLEAERAKRNAEPRVAPAEAASLFRNALKGFKRGAA